MPLAMCLYLHMCMSISVWLLIKCVYVKRRGFVKISIFIRIDYYLIIVWCIYASAFSPKTQIHTCTQVIGSQDCRFGVVFFML